MIWPRSNLVIFLTLLLASNCDGQIQLEMQAKVIERAEELSIELLGRRINLPSKRAALQNGTYKGAGYAPEFELGVWGTLGMVQCVASRTCECQWDFNYDDIVCSLGGPETQQAEKFFLYAKYVTSEICSGTAQ